MKMEYSLQEITSESDHTEYKPIESLEESSEGIEETMKKAMKSYPEIITRKPQKFGWKFFEKKMFRVRTMWV